jgi:hypothetical protein
MDERREMDGTKRTMEKSGNMDLYSVLEKDGSIYVELQN